MKGAREKASRGVISAIAKEASGYEPTGRQARAIAVSLLVLLALLAVSLFCARPAWADEMANVQTIGSADQLKAFSDSVNSGDSHSDKTVKLTADIDVSGTDWTPIGVGTRKGSGAAAGSTPFSGTFDGAGHTVSGIAISTTPDADYALGFFGILDGGTVQNLSLKDVGLTAANSELAGGAVGLLVGNGTVSNVQVSGKITGAAGIGGVVGRMTLSGTVSNCTNNATVAQQGSTGNAGGIVGAAYYTTESGQMTISGCTNNGAVSGSNATGGIAGLCCAFVGKCTNNGAVTVSGYGAGGIVGDQKNYGGINGCTNAATIANTNGQSYGTGGIVGWVRYDGAPPAYSASAPVDVTGNVNSGTVKGGNDGGGIIGCLYNAGKVSGNENAAPSISSTTFAGGIVGNYQNLSPESLPSTVPAEAMVDNNVSTTPESALHASFIGLYAYNNDPTSLVVEGNGGAWVAKLEDVRYASLPLAVTMAAGGAPKASGGGLVTLIDDVVGSDAVELDGTGTVMLNLNGHDLGFSASPAFDVSDGRLVVVGDGRVSTVHQSLESLASVAPDASFIVDGGTYRQDVSPYVGEGFTEKALEDDPDGFEFQVVRSEPATPPDPETPTPGVTTPGDNRIPIKGTPLSDASAIPASDAQRAMVSAESANELDKVGDDAWAAIAVLGSVALASAMAMAACGRARQGIRKDRIV